MKKELTTRVFQAACATLAKMTRGTVNELYTVAEISDILEAYRNKIAPENDGKDIPELSGEDLVWAFCAASELLPGLECDWCDQCKRLSRSGYFIEGCDFYCSRQCAQAAGYTDEDLDIADEGSDPDSYFIDFNAK